MRLTTLAIVGVLAGALPLRAGENRADFNWQAWRNVPAQNGGRYKPLDTLARETLRLIANRSSFLDPETGAQLDPTTLYLTMFFEWQGWQNPERDRLLMLMDWRPQYFRLHKPDKWDEAPLLRVDYLALRTVLGMGRDQQYISPVALSKVWVADPQTEGKRIPFTAWAERIDREEAKAAPLEETEKKALELANHYWAYQDLRMGRGLEILPVKGSETAEWVQIAHLLLGNFDDASDPTGDYRRAQEALRDAAKAYSASDAAAFNRSAEELKSALAALGPTLGDYPSAARMNLEVAFNRWSPFRIAWVAALLTVLGMLLHLGTGWKSLSAGSMAVFVLALAAMVTGFGMRIAISGRPPVTNMYESVVYVGFGVAVFGLIFEVIYRAKYILTAAAAVSSVALILADNSPTLLDPSVRPLEPVLRSNFWLVIHVMTITLSYAAFALALGIANISLGYFLGRSSNQSAISALSRFTYKAIQVGVLLLAAGIILGGVWADYSWGRFWGWDPKEVWALVALLGYLSMLHARFAGWVGHRGLAALSVVCFSLVVMAWYGVNFVLGAGLHSYGFGGGGRAWVFSAVALQLLYAGVAILRSRPRAPQIASQALLARGGAADELETASATV
jgi:ABC-type transport system involved in cytochrome c biogenesis permease subunit